MRLDFQFDEKALQKSLAHIEKSVFPKAAADFLNGLAFEAQKSLKSHVKEAFDGSVLFTERGFVVSKAKPQAKLGTMFAEIRIQPTQAAYLRFQIDGGTRKTGDAGSGPFDLMVFGAKRNRAGNIRRGYPKQLSKQHREEKSKRQSLRSQRESARAQGQDTSPFAYFRASRNRPGIFFGEIGGIKGYWQRPKRSKAARKRLPGVISVRPTEQLKPLLSVADHARYKPRYQYQQQIAKALRVKATQQSFAHELNRQMSKITR
ncbi:hypothetical protein [Ochrobactrum soli]|uniref:Phage protein n=1 Tax=Ochrobactrum soli TaxID=2448455 RepID=A0A2P9HNT2_9HYPH|nr:hypothetical protein [[Ochrobactrum] soli]SPL65764.1 hypothetical protein OHAE_1631 [[Ochrobactrum] soli]